MSTISKKTQIAFIGGGNMASSIIGGLVNQGIESSSICVSDLSQERRLTLEEQFGVRTSQSNIHACENANVIVLAVKPQVLKTVCLELQSSITRNQLVISIAAGIDCAALSRWLKTDTIVRTMPNTPALIGEGASGLYAFNGVDAQQKQLAEALLSTVGICVWVKEEAQIDVVTAVSGSGPAYFFLFIEAMTQSSIKLGLDKNTAQKLAIQTALGAGKLAQQSDVSVEELRKQVTSPKGTTEKAVESFINNDLFFTVDKAMQACAHRATELAIELGKD